MFSYLLNFPGPNKESKPSASEASQFLPLPFGVASLKDKQPNGTEGVIQNQVKSEGRLIPSMTPEGATKEPTSLVVASVEFKIDPQTVRSLGRKALLQKSELFLF